MRKIILLIALSPLLFAGCTPSSDGDFNEIDVKWSLSIEKTPAHRVNVITKETDGYYACFADTSIQVFFAAVPPVSGKYFIVDVSKAAHHTLAANEMAVQFNRGITDVYLSYAGDNDTCSVSVKANGYTEITIPAIHVVHYAGSSSLDTVVGQGYMDFQP